MPQSTIFHAEFEFSAQLQSSTLLQIAPISFEIKGKIVGIIVVHTRLYTFTYSRNFLLKKLKISMSSMYLSSLIFVIFRVIQPN